MLTAKWVLLGMASPAEPITKQTTVSIAVVLVIIGGVWYIASHLATTESRLEGVEENIQDIKIRQEVIYRAILSESSPVQ